MIILLFRKSRHSIYQESESLPRGEKPKTWIVNSRVVEKKLDDRCEANPRKKIKNCKQLEGS